MIRFLIPLSFFPALDHPPDFYPHKNLPLSWNVGNELSLLGVFPRFSPEFLEQCRGSLYGLLLCLKSLDLCRGSSAHSCSTFFSNWIKKSNENFLFSRNLKKGLCSREE